MYQDKVVVITGGARGIGQSLAHAYVNQGAQVIVLDLLNPQQEDNRIMYLTVDLAKPTEVKAAFTTIVRQFKTIHILINNGAISNFNKDIFEISVEEFKDVIDVNLIGTCACSREFIHANKGQTYGRIINLSSTRYNQNEAGWEAYGTSKGGIVSLTNTMAISLSETPITVNAISPGWIQTTDYEALTELDHTQHPSGRVGMCEDIVKAAMYLTDPENTFVNGHNLIVDGGMTKKMIYV